VSLLRLPAHKTDSSCRTSGSLLRQLWRIGFSDIRLHSPWITLGASNRTNRLRPQEVFHGGYHHLRGSPEKTAAELRDIAKALTHEAVQGYTQMNKEHLLPALCKASASRAARTIT
jgi:hypothetical protein